jgi:hypothetical protein
MSPFVWAGERYEARTVSSCFANSSTSNVRATCGPVSSRIGISAVASAADHGGEPSVIMLAPVLLRIVLVMLAQPRRGNDPPARHRGEPAPSLPCQVGTDSVAAHHNNPSQFHPDPGWLVGTECNRPCVRWGLAPRLSPKPRSSCECVGRHHDRA